jgi:Domain of unknown function (DUF4258)
MTAHLTSHVRARMAQRGITEADINWALAHPVGAPRPGTPGSIWVLGSTAGGRVLKVCVQAHDRDQVITAVWRDA